MARQYHAFLIFKTAHQYQFGNSSLDSENQPCTGTQRLKN